MAKLHVLMSLVLVIFLVKVHGKNNPDGGLRRSLQGDNKGTDNPSGWFGGEDGKNGTTPAPGGGNDKNETETEVPEKTDAPEAGSSPPTTEAPGSTTEAPGSNSTTVPGGVKPEGTTVPPGAAAKSAAPSSAPSSAPTASTGDGENANDDNVGDDAAGDDAYNAEEAEEAEEEWEQFEEPEEQRTKAPYVPPTGDDPFAKEPDESEWTGQENWHNETPEEMMHDQNVLIALGSAVGVGLLLALCAAHQVIENPNGCCAYFCRCLTTILCFPCRLCCGSRNRHKHDLMQAGSDSYTHDLELT